MPATIHHPEKGRTHRKAILLAQVIYHEVPGRGARLTGSLFKGRVEVPLAFRLSLGSVEAFGYTGLVGGAYHFRADDGINRPPMEVEFTVEIPAVPDTVWPRSGDNVGSATFLAYGTSSDPLDVAANQTLLLHGAATPHTATSTYYDAGTQFFSVGFTGIDNGQYILTIKNNLGTPGPASDPVIMNHLMLEAGKMQPLKKKSKRQ